MKISLEKKIKNNLKDKFLIFNRSSKIKSYCIGKHFLIYNGKNFIPVFVNENMVGYKFGEFSATRKKFIAKTKKK